MCIDLHRIRLTQRSETVNTDDADWSFFWGSPVNRLTDVSDMVLSFCSELIY